MNNTNTKNLVAIGDFNCNMLNAQTANRMTQLAHLYNLVQLIDQSTHYTEQKAAIVRENIFKNQNFHVTLLFGIKTE